MSRARSGEIRQSPDRDGRGAVRLWTWLAVALLCSAASTARAQEGSPGPEPSQSAPDAARSPALAGAVRLRGGLTLREGQQTDSGPGIRYSGTTPNDFALSGELFDTGLLAGHLGLGASVQREGFTLFEAGSPVGAVALWRVAVGPRLRVDLGALRLEAQVGYGLAQLPTFLEPGGTPEVFSRHAVLLSAAASVLLPLSLRAELGAEYPVMVWPPPTSDGPSSSGFAVGAALRLPVARFDTRVLALRAEAQLVRDTFAIAGGSSPFASTQSLVRFGIAAELSFGEPRPAPPVGAITLEVRDEQGQPIPSAHAFAGAPEQERLLDVHGDARLVLPVGPVVVRAQAPGFDPASQAAEVTPAGGTVRLVLRATGEKPSELTVIVIDHATGAPLPGARVSARGRSQTTDASGVAVFGSLTAGMAPVEAIAPGYSPDEEVAQLVAGKGATLTVALVAAARAAPARLAGTVRSAEGGPVAATLALRSEVASGLGSEHLQARTDGRGAFSLTLAGGTYQVIISAPGFLKQVKRVTVRDGEEAIFNVDLHPES